MATPFQRLFKVFIGIFAALPSLTTASIAQQPSLDSRLSQTQTMSSFVALLRRDPELRARFSQNPRDVLREYGIDPSPYNLPDSLTPEQMDRLLNDWVTFLPFRPDETRPSPSPPVAVYGPPPGRRQQP